MSSVSLCMIVRDEESILQKCLDSISWIADEIIITDTGSADQTINIAKKFTKNIHHFKWVDDFSAARNFTEKFATKDYILRWDADWILNEGSQTQLKKLKKNKFYNKDLIYFDWILDFDSNTLRPIRTEPYFFLYKNHQFHWESPIHNDLVPNNPGQISTYTDKSIKVYHHKDPDIKKSRYSQTSRILEKALQKLTPKDRQYFRLLRFQGQGFLFDKNFHKAIESFKECLHDKNLTDDQLSLIIESLTFCYINTHNTSQLESLFEKYRLENNQRYLISKADFISLKNPIDAMHYYQKAIELGPNSVDYNHERMLIHPHLMLAKINLLTNNLEKSRIHLNHCIQNSHNPSTVQECKELKQLTYE